MKYSTPKNINNVDTQTANFVVTDNYDDVRLQQNSHDFIILSYNDQHNIYVGNTFVTGGYGFDETSYNICFDRLPYISTEKYDTLSYIHGNIDKLKLIIADYNTSDTEFEIIPQTNQISVKNNENNTTSYYTLVKTLYGGLGFSVINTENNE